MDTYFLEEDLNVMGVQVTTFPLGIGDAFEALMQKLPDGAERAYFGVSYCDSKGSIIYKAATQEKYQGEAEKYNYERYFIPKGEYVSVTVKDWRQNTDCIKDVFHEIMQHPLADNNTSCIEW